MRAEQPGWFDTCSLDHACIGLKYGNIFRVTLRTIVTWNRSGKIDDEGTKVRTRLGCHRTRGSRKHEGALGGHDGDPRDYRRLEGDADRSSQAFGHDTTAPRRFAPRPDRQVQPGRSREYRCPRRSLRPGENGPAGGLAAARGASRVREVHLPSRPHPAA